jgi:hypothetical protein
VTPATAGRQALTSAPTLTLGTYKTAAGQPGDAAAMPGPVRFDSKIAVLLRDDLAVWQRLNVTAFLVSGIAGTRPHLLGEPYEDADGTRYLPMFGQPVLVSEGEGPVLTAAHQRALARELPLSVFTEELFATGNDVDNRAAVKAVARDALNLAGLAVHGPRNVVDKVLKGARLHR